MGSSIPLPALAVQAPPQPNVMGSLSGLLQMKSALGQQQMQQEQIEGARQENEMRAMQLQDMQTIQKIAPQYIQKDDSGKVTGYDFDGLQNGAIAAGVRPQSLAPLLQMRKTAADTALAQQQGNKAFLDNQKTLNDQLTGHLEAFRNAPPELKQAELDNAFATAQKNNIPWELPRDASQVTPQLLDTTEMNLAMHSQFLNEAEQKAKTAKDTTEALLNQNKLDIIQSWKQNPQQVLAQVDSIVPPSGANAALNARTKSQVQFALSNGDVDGAKGAIKMAADQVGAIEKETNPAVQAAKLHLATMEKAAEQAIADGDPKAAAQLLVSGAVAPSQLVSSRKPAFAQAAFSVAAQMQPGWSATKADADFAVAKSPANLAFFGSAKSLTDPGGTLDQLKAAGKNIPQGQFPVFNSFADIYKAQTGSGPIAHYAATLIGVADDYAKVTGGGTGTEGMQKFIMSLAPAKASQEAREAAIDGFRGAVNSQVNSRIGNNTVLQKMYGEGGPSQMPRGQPAPTGAPPATAQTHSFSISAWQRANPKGNPDAAKAAAQAQGYQVIP